MAAARMLGRVRLKGCNPFRNFALPVKSHSRPFWTHQVVLDYPLGIQSYIGARQHPLQVRTPAPPRCGRTCRLLATAAPDAHPALSDAEQHTPVLLREVLSLFESVQLHTFVDGTLGAGGHSCAISAAHPVSPMLCDILSLHERILYKW